MKLFRKLLVSLILAVSLINVTYTTTPAAYSQEQEITYVGSRNSNKYHRPSCQWARRIKPQNLVSFRSKAEVAQAGYVQCKVCRP